MEENVDYSGRLREAIKSMVEVRGQKGVRADQHLAALARLVREIFVDEGFAESDIIVKGGGNSLRLPGYFRPAKNWDLLVVEGNVLAAAIEFKSQVGSIGNNVNNRAEEAIGNGMDLWEAHREGLFGLVRPWVGYFLVLGEEPGIDEAVGLGKARFPIDQKFLGTSYVERYEILCKRLVERRVYDAACLIYIFQRSFESGNRALLRGKLRPVCSRHKGEGQSSRRSAQRPLRPIEDTTV